MGVFDPETSWRHANSRITCFRLGLCFKVDRGDLTVDLATEIFENMKSTLISAKEMKIEEE